MYTAGEPAPAIACVTQPLLCQQLPAALILPMHML
jgi:hypothetical protein